MNERSGVELPEATLRSIDRLAHQGRITRSEVIRRLVGKALADEQPTFAPGGEFVCMRL